MSEALFLKAKDKKGAEAKLNPFEDRASPV